MFTTPQLNAMPPEKRRLTMKGNIYPTETGYRVKFQGIYKRFKNTQEAERFLNRLRHEEDEGTFDKRDWLASKPLGFTNLAQQWLTGKKEKVKCYSNLRNHISQAILYFGNTNIKTIQFSELENFYLSLPVRLSEKTKANIFTTLHAFFVWIVKREKRDKRHIEMPEFPVIRFELRRRKTISREQQLLILDWLKVHAPFKVWLGIKWLMTYISIRPGELIEIKEGDINRELGVIYVKDNKGKRVKSIPLLQEDQSFIQNKALPHVYFFRHQQRKGVAPYNRYRFGKRCLYTWWRRACGNLELRHTDLYGGTCHSTVQWLYQQGYSPEEISRAKMHTSVATTYHYLDIGLEEVRQIYGGGKVVEMRRESDTI